ncbi:MAG: alpha/beta hydrolase [Hyphomicrobiales bacterium]|nr:alpha/beta hydrolase [Hyphomicrobiales bacterium]
MTFTQREFMGLGPAGFHRVAYTEWGGAADSAGDLICVHGLARNGRDFDTLAAGLADRYRVACPDLPGRGASDWLPVPEHYGLPLYMGDMAALIARLGGRQVDWVGTSLGGLIGMSLAAQPNSPIRRLVINDIGPFVPQAGLQRIGAYVGADPVFADMDALEARLRDVCAPFGPLTDAQWRHLATHGGRRDGEGRLRLHYDPAIAWPYKNGAEIQDISLWPVWDAVQCPVLVLHGRESDVLLAETAQEMTRRGPMADLVELDGIGHAPALMDPDQVRAVRDWLLAA